MPRLLMFCNHEPTPGFNKVSKVDEEVGDEMVEGYGPDNYSVFGGG